VADNSNRMSTLKMGAEKPSSKSLRQFISWLSQAVNTQTFSK
jgi:hypothetical protein